MSKKEKLLLKVENGPNNVTIDILLRLMKYYGFMPERASDGYFFKNEKLKTESLPHVPIPHGRENKVKRPYIKKCLEAIELLKEKESEESI
ncbi:MAG TPA: hypothetical protein VI914_04905 [Thermodesulfobacteriota bacterium]|nr:hypothetical protein [Thermodesulfobacteriota bacterium]HZX35158.1 hypothetical protein [Thermodesulfobacteriota bacterium]